MATHSINRRGFCGTPSCRSELARDGLKGDAFIQKTRIIVNVHREQARLLQMQRKPAQSSSCNLMAQA